MEPSTTEPASGPGAGPGASAAGEASAIDGPARWQVPPLRSDEAWFGGVAAAISAELGVTAAAVRAAFVILALQGGWGVVLYGLAWVWLGFVHPSRVNLYHPQPKARSERFRYLGFALIVFGAMLIGAVLGFSIGNRLMVPFGLIALGGLIAWSRRLGESGMGSTLRVVLGVVVAASGVISAYLMLTSERDLLSLAPILVANLGLLAVAVPSVARIGRDLDDERSERVRADERAKVAAHLHDSVLQTLTLIQKNAGDAERTAQLARQQERELRAWLYGTAPADPSSRRMEPALQSLAAAVEQRHHIRVNIVVVGDDQELEAESLRQLVAAAQEAVINAAKHAKVDEVDVYAEVGRERIELFIRDDGCGFDPSAIDADRRGLSESIVARMERLGGTAAVHSEPGEGTEVELVLPLTGDRTDPDRETANDRHRDGDGDGNDGGDQPPPTTTREST